MTLYTHQGTGCTITIRSSTVHYKFHEFKIFQIQDTSVEFVERNSFIVISAIYYPPNTQAVD